MGQLRQKTSPRILGSFSWCHRTLLVCQTLQSELPHLPRHLTLAQLHPVKKWVLQLLQLLQHVLYRVFSFLAHTTTGPLHSPTTGCLKF